jgi:23S rRNA pseudouridine1911/1915/1917 synthase
VIEHVVTPERAGRRLDALLAEIEPALSRAQARRLIEQGQVTVSGGRAKPSHRVRAGARIEGRVPEPEEAGLEPEAIALSVVHEDADLIVIDKPAGLVVHPAPGHARGTLVHALLYHCRDLSGVGGVARPGIVHRLDKGTSGLLVAAKHDRAHRSLAAQFKLHSIEREYLALVRGTPRAESGSIRAPIGRHPTDRKRFSTRVSAGRTAVTHWSVERRFATHTLLRVRLETGRTHQIRVHLASVGLPIAGDPLYGGGRRSASARKGAARSAVGRKGAARSAVLPGLERPALHAARLGFDHPTSGERLRFESGLPDDLRRVLEELRT